MERTMHGSHALQALRDAISRLGPPVLAGLALLLFAGPAAADTTGCLVDMDGEPLRRTYFTHDFVDYLTDEAGCFSIPPNPPAGSNSLRIEVHRQNTVVRMDDGATGRMISQRLDVVNGATTTVFLDAGTGRSAHMQIAESMRQA
jgi:hypothetical protein